MFLDDIIFISAQPHDPYFQWQVEVQIVNFRKFNVSKLMHILVWYPEGSKQLDKWRALQEKYKEVKIFLYKDQGVNLGLYISQLRPHILKQHFLVNERILKNKNFFYHDSDIIFNYLPDFGKLTQGEIVWQSDTSSYLDYTYLKKKEKEGSLPDNLAINTMAHIGQIKPDIIQSYDRKTGGAQTLLKGQIDYDFWSDIERMCLEIRNNFSFHVPESINRRYFKSEAEGFQSWCADMWAINFALWKRGIETNITKELDFSWATDTIETYNRKPIFHNAGATKQTDSIFYKGAYINKNPFMDKNLPMNENMASSMYVKAIREVE